MRPRLPRYARALLDLPALSTRGVRRPVEAPRVRGEPGAGQVHAEVREGEGEHILFASAPAARADLEGPLPDPVDVDPLLAREHPRVLKLGVPSKSLAGIVRDRGPRGSVEVREEPQESVGGRRMDLDDVRAVD